MMGCSQRMASLAMKPDCAMPGGVNGGAHENEQLLITFIHVASSDGRAARHGVYLTILRRRPALPGGCQATRRTGAKHPHRPQLIDARVITDKVGKADGASLHALYHRCSTPHAHTSD
jgi:hypothetical protein